MDSMNIDDRCAIVCVRLSEPHCQADKQLMFGMDSMKVDNRVH